MILIVLDAILML